MTQVIQQVNINLIPQIFGANSVLVPCSQYDKTYRVIQFNVYNGRELYSIPSTCTVIIRGTKKDLTGFEYNCEFSGSQVIFPLEPQITVLSGKVPAELRIVNGEELIGSANFLFMVEPSPLTDDTIISETQLPLLEEALQAAAEAEQSKILAEAAKDSAEESATNASESEANALTYSQNAQASANSASQSASNASTSEQNAKESEELAQGYSQDAETCASNASDSAESASQSAQSASQSAQHAEDVVQDIEDYVTEAQGYAEQSLTSAQNASVSAQNALTSENNAHTSEVNARASEQSASQSETNASASATSASQSASNASQSATNSSNSATQSANSATQASQSATSAQNSATSAEESATEAQEILDNIDSLIANKADQDGIYPNMSVGSAEKLLTSETIDDQFTYKTISHDGYARINSVKGNTIIWNQLINIDSPSRTLNGITTTNNGDGSFTINGTATANTNYQFNRGNVKANHKYLCLSDSRVAITFAPVYSIVKGNKIVVPTTDGSNVAQSFYFANGESYDNVKSCAMIIDLTAMFGAGNEPTVDQFKSLFPLSFYQYDTGSLLSFNGEGIKTVGKNIFDFSQFANDTITFENGALSGTAQDFHASYSNVSTNGKALDYPQNTPITISFKAKCTGSGSSSRGLILRGLVNGETVALLVTFNSYTTERQVSVQIDANTHVDKLGFSYGSGGTLTWTLTEFQVEIGSSATSYSPYNTSTLELPISQYFPNGMKSAGNVFDELTSKKAITRVGVIDLGYINWTMYNHSSLGTYFYASVSSYSVKYVGDFIFTAYPATCAKYTSVRRAAADFVDKTLCFDGNTSNQQVTQIQIKDSAYTDATAFKSAMSGVYLYYELATPIETDIDLDLTYTIESGGTEQLLPINSCVPVTSPMSRNVSFFYDSNVVSNLLTLLSSVAQVETSPTTHSYAVGDYLIYNYQLYKVNSAIAVGGTLTVGTNIVATTLVDIINS